MTDEPHGLLMVEVQFPARGADLPPPVLHRCSEALSNAEIVRRFGIARHARVTIWPATRPDLARVIQEGGEG